MRSGIAEFAQVLVNLARPARALGCADDGERLGLQRADGRTEQAFVDLRRSRLRHNSLPRRARIILQDLAGTASKAVENGLAARADPAPPKYTGWRAAFDGRRARSSQHVPQRDEGSVMSSKSRSDHACWRSSSSRACQPPHRTRTSTPSWSAMAPSCCACRKLKSCSRTGCEGIGRLTIVQPIQEGEIVWRTADWDYRHREFDSPQNPNVP